MIRSALFKQFESGDRFFFKVLRFVVLVGGIFLLGVTGSLELTWPQQIVFGILTVALVVWLDRSSSSYLVTLTLMLASVFSTFRYGFWRLSTSIGFFADPGSTWSALDAFFVWLLIFAEAYAVLILLLGYLQTLWPLRRMPVPLPDDIESWPAVDLLIPTYNEPLSVVKYTVLASLNIDWPAEKLNIYILDDGRREEFRRFAEEAGIGYMTREDNKHAKAGNINHALSLVDAPYVAIFDCDHVPTRSFLQVTMGWFVRDRKLAMLQTPHHFYSPDPFERNLDQLGSIPNEGELFYRVVQDGNDFWNATFFCGSCAVLRRAALDEIGGVAVETVTEDAHTSLRMQRKGWNTAYINIPQAAGLATERLSGHIKQRIRWARGMIQIMRIDNPLFVRGLTLAQRMCYFNAMTHFLYALPRLIFLTAPLIYLIFGHVNLPGFWAAILAYAIPHLVLSNVANSRIQGQHRHSFWNEIYETVLAPYILLPTMLALINPRFGSFGVTAKGGVVNHRSFDRRIAQPFLFMISMNVLGILCAVPRFFQFPGAETGWPLNILAGMYDGRHMGTIVMNLLWVCFNTVILGVATSVAWESRQRRQTVRLTMTVPADVELANGSLIHGVTTDMSIGGMMIRMERDFTANLGDSVKLTLPVLDGSATLPGTLVGMEGNVIRAQFDPLTLQEEEALAMVLYSRADTWLGWNERAPDRPLTSLRHILGLALHGLAQAVRGPKKAAEIVAKGDLVGTVAPFLLVALLFARGTVSAQVLPLAALRFSAQAAAAVEHLKPTDAQTKQHHEDDARPLLKWSGVQSSPPQDGSVRSSVPAPGTFDNVIALSEFGVPETIVLRGQGAYGSVHFSLPQNQLVKTATLRLLYHFSPGLIPSLSHMKVSLNGNLFATLLVAAPDEAPSPTSPSQTDGAKESGDATTANSVRSSKNGGLEATLTIPVEKLRRDNELRFEFVGHYTLKCEDPSHSTLWSQVDNNSTIEFAGTLLPLHDDLKLLPAPFYDSAVNLRPVIPIVFMSQPSLKALQAAGILASWFGILADSRPVRFPISIGVIPVGDAIVIAENSTNLPPSLQGNAGSGPSISMRSNPSDPYSKVLVLAGGSANDVLKATYALALQRDLLEGGQVRISGLKLPARRDPDDAPRWLNTEQITPLGDLPQVSELKNNGSGPISISMRLPPDLCFSCAQRNLGFHLGYRYNSLPVSNDSTLQVLANDSYVGSTPLPHSDKASAQLDTFLSVPVSDMRPFSNSFRMRFLFLPSKSSECQDNVPSTMQGSILTDSYLDLRGIPHWTTLPNLEIFANAGYPFTRRADLSDTAVVLPELPSTEEIEMFVTLMGHFGAQTGYPVFNVTVTNSDGMKADGEKDYLVLGTVDDQAAIGRLNGALPVGIDGSGLHIQDTQGFFAQLQHAWWKVRSSDRIQSGELETAGGLPDALIEGAEWPARSNRSVVVVALRDRSVVSNFLSVFLKDSQTSNVSQSVSVLHGSRFVSYRIGNDMYRVGSLSPWVQLKMLFSDYLWLMVICVFLCCFLMAAILRSVLRKKARARLRGTK